LGIGTTAPICLLSNTNSNSLDTEGKGTSSTSLSWNMSGAGRAASFVNTGTGGGVMVKVASNGTSEHALDVSRGATSAAGTPLFVVESSGNVGIGTSSPGNRLEVNSGTAGLSGLRFTNMDNSSAASTSGVATLGVNANGDVVVASSTTTDILARARFNFGDVGVATAPAPALSGAVNISSVSKLDGNNMRVFFTNAVPTTAFVMVQLRVNAGGTSSSYISNQTTTFVDITITEWCCGQNVQIDLMVLR
jgi:hypothetical protein